MPSNLSNIQIQTQKIGKSWIGNQSNCVFSLVSNLHCIYIAFEQQQNSCSWYHKQTVLAAKSTTYFIAGGLTS